MVSLSFVLLLIIVIAFTICFTFIQYFCMGGFNNKHKGHEVATNYLGESVVAALAWSHLGPEWCGPWAKNSNRAWDLWGPRG